MTGSRIKQIKTRQILDNNGRPAVEVDVITKSGHVGRAGASTGTSVGINEACVLRDDDPNLFNGLSVYKALENIEKRIAPAIIGMDVFDQAGIDNIMIELDGTRQKTNLGGNAVYGVSCAVLRAMASVKGQPLYLAMADTPPSYVFCPTSNIINGGTYDNKTLAFQEFMIIPYDVTDANTAVRMIVEVFMRLGKVIEKASGGKKPNMGNYSGHGAPSDDPFEVFDLIQQAVVELGYQKNICYAIDCAASEFYDSNEKAYKYRGKFISRDELINILARLANKYPIAFIEDALEEEDFEGYKLASERINSVIAGDDFLCTNVGRTKKAVEMGAVKGMVFKPNQAGTITEALAAAEYMKQKGLLVIPSGRAGGTSDSAEKEMAIALGMVISKMGAPRATRINAFNMVMRVAEELDVPVANVRELPFFSHLKSSGLNSPFPS